MIRRLDRRGQPRLRRSSITRSLLLIGSLLLLLGRLLVGIVIDVHRVLITVLDSLLALCILILLGRLCWRFGFRLGFSISGGRDILLLAVRLGF